MIPIYNSIQKEKNELLDKKLAALSQSKPKRTELETIFWESLVYFFSANELKERKTRNEFELAACLLLSFSLELAIKCLVKIDNKQFKFNHSIIENINLLDISIQNQLLSEFKNIFRDTTRDEINSSSMSDTDKNQCLGDLNNEIDNLQYQEFIDHLSKTLGQKESYFVSMRYLFSASNTLTFEMQLIYMLVTAALNLCVKHAPQLNEVKVI